MITVFSGKLKGPIVKFNKWGNSKNPVFGKSGYNCKYIYHYYQFISRSSSTSSYVQLLVLKHVFCFFRWRLGVPFTVSLTYSLFDSFDYFFPSYRLLKTLAKGCFKFYLNLLNFNEHVQINSMCQKFGSICIFYFHLLSCFFESFRLTVLDERILKFYLCK